MQGETDGAQVAGDADGLDSCAVTSTLKQYDVTNHGDGTATIDEHCDDWVVTFDETGMTSPDCMRTYSANVTEGPVDIVYTLSNIEFSIEEG